jgi:hypothetical protein
VATTIVVVLTAVGLQDASHISEKIPTAGQTATVIFQAMVLPALSSTTCGPVRQQVYPPMTQKWPLVSRFPLASGVAANRRNAGVNSPAQQTAFVAGGDAPACTSPSLNLSNPRDQKVSKRIITRKLVAHDITGSAQKRAKLIKVLVLHLHKHRGSTRRDGVLQPFQDVNLHAFSVYFNKVDVPAV